MVASSRSVPHLRVVSDRSPGELGEAALTGALRRREPWAAELTWKRYAPAVYGLLARALGRGADVEALTQEVFLGLFPRMPALEEPAALKSFIYSQAIVVLRREFRRRWFRKLLSRKDRGLGNGEARWLLDRPARLVLSRLYELLDGLRPDDRVLFTLREIEGMSHGEIAAILGKPLLSIKRKVARVCARVELLVRADSLIEHYVAHVRPPETDRLEGA